MGKSPVSVRNQHIADLVKSGKTLEEVGAEFNITRERVRQIFRKAYPDHQLIGRKNTTRGRATQARIDMIRQAIMSGLRTSEDIKRFAIENGCPDISAGHTVVIIRGLRKSDPEVAKVWKEYEPAADLVGKSFGAWTVLSGKHWYRKVGGGFTDSTAEAATPERYLECSCSCGYEPYGYVSKSNLLSGLTKGCVHCLVERSDKHPAKRWPVPVRGKSSGRRFGDMKEAAEALGMKYTTFVKYLNEGRFIAGEEWERLG